MSGYALNDALRREFLQGVIEKFPQTDLVGVTTFGGRGGRGKPVMGLSAKWDVLERSRTTAPFRGYDSPSKSRKLRVRERKESTLFLQALNVPLSESVMEWIERPGGQSTAEQLIAGEQRNIYDEIDRTKEWMVWQALSTGAVAVAQDDVKASVDYGIPTANKTLAASAAWSTSTTDIPLDLNNWQIILTKASGVRVTDAWMNRTTMGYLISNDFVKDRLGDTYKDQIAKTGRVMMLNEINLHVVDGNYDAAGTITDFIDDNKVVLTCGQNFTEFQIGTARIPEDTGNGAATVQGRYTYAYTQKDPVVHVVVVGENYLFVINEPERVGFCPDVTA